VFPGVRTGAFARPKSADQLRAEGVHAMTAGSALHMATFLVNILVLTTTRRTADVTV
jgi:hypothetical protein